MKVVLPLSPHTVLVSLPNPPPSMNNDPIKMINKDQKPLNLLKTHKNPKCGLASLLLPTIPLGQANNRIKPKFIFLQSMRLLRLNALRLLQCSALRYIAV
jgi:hypothetical protein